MATTLSGTGSGDSRLKLRYWRWVQKYKIINPPTTDGYAVPFTLNYLPGTNPYFLDIQPAIGDQLLPFWIEHAAGIDYTSNTPFTSPNIWVRLPSGCTSVDIYRGNPRITTDRSDGNRTFDFFDDFLGNALDTGKWNAATGGTVSVADSVVSFTPTSSWQALTGKQAVSKNNALVVETRIKSQYIGISQPSALSFVIQEAATGFGGLRLQAAFSNTETDKGARYDILNGSWYWGAYNELHTSFANTWIKLKLVRAGSASWYINGANNVVKTSGYFTNDGYPSFHTYGGSGTIACDWILARKYTATEPTPQLINPPKTNPIWRGG